MASVYILSLTDNSYYIGSTDDLTSRLKRHEAGQVPSTKNKLPFILQHVEQFATRGTAQSREYQIKKWKSRKAIERLIRKK